MDLLHVYMHFNFFYREKIKNWSEQKPIVHHFTSIPVENLDQFIRRTAAEMIPVLIKIGALQIDIAEYERLPDKQIEPQINDETQ